MTQFLLFVFLGFIGLELFSYVVHRWLFHGVLWGIHKSHHVSRKGAFELNDLFSVVFGSSSVLLLVFAQSPKIDSIAFPMGLGIALYGLIYFITHDLFTHRRFLPFSSGNTTLLTIRAAHQHHHQSVEKQGMEPFGLFIFNFRRFYTFVSERRNREPIADVETTVS